MRAENGMNMTPLDEITEKVIGCLFRVSNSLGAGFLEKVYENASRIEIAKLGLRVQQQFPIEVQYAGAVVGQFSADLLVAGLVLVEFKAVKSLEDIHTAQCLNHLRATGFPVCLLVNFYRPKVEIKRLVASETWLRR